MLRGGERLTRSGYATVIAIVAVIVALDQATKWCVHRSMHLHQSVPVIEGLFNLTYIRNAGAAFGLLGNLPPAVRGPLFVAVSIGALVVLVVLLFTLRRDQQVLRVTLATVLGGAIGNMIDRLRVGEVIDFLDVHWRGYHWPAFNVADSCITVGVIVLLILSFSARPAAPDGS